MDYIKSMSDKIENLFEIRKKVMNKLSNQIEQNEKEESDCDH
jgi:hypothetical protein